jgi:WD40 repeat protein/tRNA A-37 threonylcarbamoyl transferase component Bud32
MNHADRNLLLGALAVQTRFVTRDDLMAAMRAWVRERSQSLGRILVEQQALSPSRQALLEQLVDEHLAAHGGDAEKSLAALDGVGAIRDEMQRIADSGPDATVAHISADRHTIAPEAAATMSDGAAAAGAAAAGADGSRFSILRPHAKGGLGQVSVALDSELNREVALKELRPERADDADSRARFLLEAEITGHLEHPGVVPVYGLGCDSQGRPFYAMRFVKGDTLQEAIDRLHASGGSKVSDPREWNLAVRQLLNRFVAVCNVMAYAHSRGVIHRDLKPANILLGPYGETLVVDWGLAKVVGRSEPAARPGAVEVALQPGSRSGSSETLPGTAMGTPAYMSPEQADGDLEQVGPLSDLYSLGATLYCLLTGKPPINETDVREALRRVQRGEFPPPREVNPRVPRALEAIALLAMALKPEDRYASPRALADDLERWLGDEPLAVYREPLATRLVRWGRRHRTLATGLGALLVTAVVALAISTALIGREQAATERQRARAVLAAESLRREDYIHRINLADRELSVDNLRRALELLGDCPSDLRDWEWDYLMRLCRVEPMVLKATAEVHGVAFRPDGEQIAAACQDGTVKVLDSWTGRVVQTLPDHGAAVFGVAFGPDGRHLAVASEDRSIRLLDLATGREVFRRAGQVGDSQGLAYSVAFSPDGRRLVAGSEVVGSEVGLAVVWNVADGSEVCRLPGHEKAAESVAFSPDGRLVATGSWAGVLRIWDAGTGQLVRAIPAHGIDRIGAVAFHPDGRTLATASYDRTVKLWDVATGAPLRTLTGHPGFVTGLAFSRDGRRLATIGGEDKTVKIWDPLTGRELLTLRGHTDMCTGVAFSPDGRRLVSASNDQTIRIWDATALTGNEGMASLTCEHDDEVGSVAFSPDGGSLVSSSWNTTVWLWDAKTGARLRTFTNPGRVFYAVFRPDGRQIAAAGVSPGRTAFVTVWDAATGGEAGPAIHENSMPFSVAFGPDGRYLLKEGPGHTVKVWDAQTRDPLGEIGRHDHQIWAMKFSPDGRRLATASLDGTVRVWAWDPARLGEMQKPELTLSARVIGFGDRVAFSQDGLHLATGGEEHTITVWGAKTGRREQTLRGHTGDVFAVAFDPDGRWLASAGEDTTVRLWDTTSSPWELRHTLRGHTGFVMSLAFSPDGSRLVSGSRDRTLKVWDLARLVQRP